MVFHKWIWIIDKEHKGTEDDLKHFPWDKFVNRE